MSDLMLTALAEHYGIAPKGATVEAWIDECVASRRFLERLLTANQPSSGTETTG